MYKNYLIVAVRNIMRQRAHNILNVFGLAMGIASGLIIAIHIRGELSYETSFDNYENIYRVHREGWATSTPALASEFRDFFPEVTTIARFAPFGTRVVTTENNNPGEATGFFADASVLKVFGFKILDGDPNPLVAINTVVLTRKMATRYFANTSAIGKILKLDNGQDVTVTAVMDDPPSNSHLKFDYLISMPTFYWYTGEGVDSRRGWMIMYSYAVFEPGTHDRVLTRMPDFIRKYYHGDPEIDQKVESRAWRLMSLKDIHLHSNFEKEMHPNSSIIYVYIFIAVELLILIVASANFMSLFTTQALRRMKEVGMRKVMGARPGQLVGQFFTEVSVLILLATTLAIILYQLAIPLYNDLTGKSLGIWEVFEPSNLIVAGIILLMVLIVSGLYPALFMTGLRPGSFLRERKLPNSMPNLVRSGLLVFQFAVSVSLIAAAIIVRQQMDLMKNKDLGFDKEQVVSVKLYGDLWGRAFREGDAVKEDFLRNPDVLSVGRVDRLIGERLSVESVVPEGKDPERDKLPDMRVLRADEGYIEAMGIKVIDGRIFSSAFNDSTSFIINERAARALGLHTPVGEILESHSTGRKGRVVGVVEDYHFATLHAEIEPMVIEFDPESTSNLVFRIRSGKATEALEHIRNTVDRLAPNSLFIYQFLDDRVDALYRSEDTMGKVFEFFSALAIVIACLGLFGLSSHTIETRTKEIGIRKVLGATVSRIIALVSSNVFCLIVIGFVIAVPLTWVMMNKWLSNFAYKIEITWWVFALTGLIIILVAAFSIGYRTIQAALANPVDSLRNE